MPRTLIGKLQDVMHIEVKVRERILKPVDEVFDAFVDPRKMSNYFISSASGLLLPGKTVVWEFADVGAKVTIKVLEVEKNTKVIYESAALGTRTVTTIRFVPDGTDATIVSITESKFRLDEGGVHLALGQCAGWTYTLCGLKAYVQFGINLRTGLNKRLTDI